ncbi:SusC/RagA family TonB-linked outer membrane protein [Parapedobacter tibetensis]|uniref:SusC/RagA family TonB-linked outer membrane protein n=1 Tax=Parapedobacter tibetensis TaxID=2972951 RepID=UPI00214D221E|nr:TonB-dependent receptor [Parapedobacter tibetensis]
MRKLFTCCLFFLCSVLVYGQQRTVSGSVTDATTYEGIEGVTIAVQGSTVAVQSGEDGRYSINAAGTDVLVFRYIGYASQEISINNRAIIDVALEPESSELDEVVVVGYGTQRKRDLTGAIASVSGEEISRQPALSPLASLQGKVAGLTVVNGGRAGTSPVIRIRGISSTKSANPLFVVDGLLQDNIDYLNPADIESVDLLRDASSSAIYGLRGANGVIAITTKRADRGQTRVNFVSNVGIQTVPNKIDVTDAEGFKKLYSAQLANLNADPFDFTNYTGNTNWQDLVMRDAVINTNSLSLSTSGEKSTTLISFSYNNQDGVLKYNSYQKYILRLNQEIRVTDNFKVGGDITGFHAIANPSQSTNPFQSGLNNALWAAPIVPVQEDATTYYSMPSFQRAQVGNPVATLNRLKETSINKNFRFNGSVFAEVNFLTNFTLRSTVYAGYGFNHSRGYTPLPFTFINVGENGNPNEEFFDTNARTSVNQSQSASYRYQQDHTLNYDKTFDGGHRLNAMVGFTTLRWGDSNVSGSRQDSTLNVPNNPDLWYLGVVNVNNILNNGGEGSLESNAGGFARVSYGYQDKYLFNGTVRRDGSSRFAPENRWGTFGSVGLGWVASAEDFFIDHIKGIDYLKLRASWGRLGNSNGVDPNLYQQGLSNAATAVFGDNVYTAVGNEYIPDPNLRFEVVQGTDVGLDLRAFNNRFNAEINLYDKTTDGILTSFPLRDGGKPYFTNLGEITNRGIEINLGWGDRIGNDFTYKLSGNFSYNENKVESLGNNSEFQITGNGGVNLTNSGYSIGYFYGYTQTGIYQTPADLTRMPTFANSLPGDIAYEDTDGDGTITPADRTYLGTPFPPYSFGLSLSLGYKGFDALIEGQGVAGNMIYTQRRTRTFAVLNYESNRLNAWTAPGSTNVEPILDNTRGNNFLFSTHYLEPGDYFRLRNVQLGYTFGANTLSRVGIKQMRVFINGQNIKTWSQVTGYTPEAQIGDILGGGADNGVYPVPAIYTLGLNVTF